MNIASSRSIPHWLFAVAALSFSIPSGTLEAQEKREMNSAHARADNPSVQAVEAVGLASQLAQYGYDNQSALALITAAEILIGHPVQRQAREKLEMGGDQEAGDKAEDETVLEPGALLDDAAQMASANAEVQQTIQRIRRLVEAGQRGAVGGPIVHHDRVLAYTTDVYTIDFRGGEPAGLIVDGDDDTDLDVYVYDENGNLIASDLDYSDYNELWWTPRWTGSFRIEVRNLGGVWNAYRLVTN